CSDARSPCQRRVQHPLVSCSMPRFLPGPKLTPGGPAESRVVGTLVRSVAFADRARPRVRRSGPAGCLALRGTPRWRTEAPRSRDDVIRTLLRGALQSLEGSSSLSTLAIESRDRTPERFSAFIL